MKKTIFTFLTLILFTVSSNAFLNNPNQIVDVVKKTKNAVVNISTTKIVKRSKYFHDFDMFHKFFGDQFKDFYNNQPQEFKTKSLGSGFIIDKKGFIVTNNHVIENADEIIVKLSDEKEFKAKIVGRDPLTDLALLKIDPKDEDLTVLEMGDSSKTEVGEIVVAIGNPFGLEFSVTAGIISAKGRVLGSGPYDNFMQTDASINPGNSGGPLVNLEGKVIGINTAIIASAQGLGFAIPVNMLKELLPKLKTGKVLRGWLGVTVQHIDDKLAKTFGLKDTKGALIADVVKGDPADKAGIKAGDIVLKINGKNVSSEKDLINIIGRMSPKEIAKLEILRDGKIIHIDVKLGKRPDKTMASNSNVEPDSNIVVEDLTKQQLKEFGIDHGVVVKNVKKTSNAYEAGIRKGDIIVWINRKDVKSSDEFYEIMDKIKSKEVVAMKIVSKQGSRFIAYEKE
jgi:serine protease Do